MEGNDDKKKLSEIIKEKVKESINEEDLLKLEELEKAEGGAGVCAVACLWSEVKVVSSKPIVDGLEEEIKA